MTRANIRNFIFGISDMIIYFKCLQNASNRYIFYLSGPGL